MRVSRSPSPPMTRKKKPFIYMGLNHRNLQVWSSGRLKASPKAGRRWPEADQKSREKPAMTGLRAILKSFAKHTFYEIIAVKPAMTGLRAIYWFIFLIYIFFFYLSPTTEHAISPIIARPLDFHYFLWYNVFTVKLINRASQVSNQKVLDKCENVWYNSFRINNNAPHTQRSTQATLHIHNAYKEAPGVGYPTNKGQLLGLWKLYKVKA